MMRQPSANGDRLSEGVVRLSFVNQNEQRDTPLSAGFEWSHTITFSSARVFCQRCCLFIVKGTSSSAGCLFIGVGGVANQQAVNMFVKSLIIRVGRGLTAVPAAVKGQKA